MGLKFKCLGCIHFFNVINLVFFQNRMQLPRNVRVALNLKTMNPFGYWVIYSWVLFTQCTMGRIQQVEVNLVEEWDLHKP